MSLVQFKLFEKFLCFSLANPLYPDLSEFRNFLNDKLQEDLIPLCFGYIYIYIIEYLIVPKLMNDSGKSFAGDGNPISNLQPRGNNNSLCIVVLSPFDLYAPNDKISTFFQSGKILFLREGIDDSHRLESISHSSSLMGFLLLSIGGMEKKYPKNVYESSSHTN